MTLLRSISYLMAVVAMLLLSSCIDGREEVWLNTDGSGRARFRYDIPATTAKLQGGKDGVEKLLDSILLEFPGATREVTITGSRMTVEVALTFSSTEAFSKIRDPLRKKKAPSSLQPLVGVFDVKRQGLEIDFTRTVSPGKVLPTAFIPSSEFRDRKLTYILHLPVVPQESTADRTESGGRTLIWERPLSTAINNPVVIHFKAPIPISRKLIAATAVGFLTGAVLLGFGVKKLLRRKRQS